MLTGGCAQKNGWEYPSGTVCPPNHASVKPMLMQLAPPSRQGVRPHAVRRERRSERVWVFPRPARQGTRGPGERFAPDLRARRAHGRRMMDDGSVSRGVADRGSAGASVDQSRMIPAFMPPSTSSTDPVQNDDSALAKKTAASAMSVARPILPAGGVCQREESYGQPSSPSGGAKWRIPGSMSPGQMQFERTPSGPPSSAHIFESMISAALEIE